jgi:CDP-diacylglycerol--glycerol-3-phosphate 3-phosphatidyltransferase
MVPFFIAAVLYNVPDQKIFRMTALAIFLVAVISDVVDGYIARRWHQRSPAGVILDPIADKLLLMSAFLCLYKIGAGLPVVSFPKWLIVAVISRDVILLIGAGIIYCLHGRMPVEATFWGKSSTCLQVLTVIAMLLQWPALWLWQITLVLTVISGIDYLRIGIQVINSSVEKDLAGGLK